MEQKFTLLSRQKGAEEPWVEIQGGLTKEEAMLLLIDNMYYDALCDEEYEYHIKPE